MKPALAFRQPHYPKSWQDLPNGDIILSAIENVLEPWWQKFFGYHLLKIGALSHEISCEHSPIKNQVSCSPNPCSGSQQNYNTDIVCELDDLPLLEHSVDVCLLSHVLEFSLDPHHVIREANRALIPNGYLVITGFNPFSLAGLNRIIPYRRKTMPWNEHFFSPMRVKDWLQLMGFEILSDERCLYSSLAGKMNEHGLANYWHSFAKNYLTSVGSVYVIIAKKRVLPLTPIKPKWQIRAKFNPVKIPSMNVNSENKNNIPHK
ncbi:methyltransferase domain-containing protein [Colwellia sp. 4_MG-2023]|uniref:class I SAM-dependent methyltransferase n=1 Tax=unclassified Colwellia TaxID=196834 RepID=UPI001C0979E5|nr:MULTISPECIES: class I SAM-dependent methyltransferase [unclassified Colwellia]MBU2924331.1 methyltransferase domain-containing protein [Colwellia sp. C2M11]MDO6505446.1 methyltransferase domain-containing protein [Colwellia sp. 5_MG-2023]MDO6554258.1 methyltransferase domain-containing protein [Colwellia sp. 4_MG-2023]MDO6650867.1 methyltransferase domain-containing protein [Colwellia sp. 3_MG-2023]MDO6663902.1 methyltransferase domain-containing protein [Colwellia sp. 2_MG-2023]